MNLPIDLPRRLRASGWLALAVIGALLVGLLFGGVQYLVAWAGACAKVASGAWGGYWISRNVARTDPSERATALERSVDKLTLGVIVAATIIGVSLAV